VFGKQEKREKPEKRDKPEKPEGFLCIDRYSFFGIIIYGFN